MNFGSGGSSDSKAWRDIWGCGQGIGAVKSIESAGALVARLGEEYRRAAADLTEELAK
jgi:nitronate monooxygenase